ncbi:transposase [Bradyrhizobium diazoefficiens]|nr:transposase [Bradyrhizobium diazoefficiens]QQN65405.1 transposase [Bradyrhizobium diazoefficiens]
MIRTQGVPIIETACRAHGRRKFFDLARLRKAPISTEAVKRINLLFAIERKISGLAPQERLRARQEPNRQPSGNNDTIKANHCCLSRLDAFSPSFTTGASA